MQRIWIWPTLIALVAGAAYAVSLSNGFTLDDVQVVEKNHRLQSLDSIPGHFSEPYWPVEGPQNGLYRPVTIASFTINRALTGPSPQGFHWVNVLLHMLVSVLAWFTLRHCGTHYGTAFLGGMLFAVHPLHAEAVANVVGRSELLVAAGVLLAWAAHRRSFERTRATPWRIAAWLAYLFAILSKESAILAPLVFLADDLSLGREGRRGWRAATLQFAGYAAAASLMLLLRQHALGALFPPSEWFFLDNPAAAAGPIARLLTAGWVQLLYASLFVVPWRMTSDYGFDVIPLVRSLADPRAWLGLLWLSAVAVALVQGLRRHRTLLLATAVWVAFLLPSANLLFPVGTLMGERLTYLASFGGCLLVGHVGAWFVFRSEGSRRTRGIVVVVLATIVCGILATHSWQRSKDWRSNFSLALADAHSTPRAAKVQLGLGLARKQRGDTEGAEQGFQRAVDIWPDYAQAHYNLGASLLDRNDSPAARVHLERARDLAGGTFLPYEKLAPLYEQLGKTGSALEAYATGLLIAPEQTSFRFNYARLLLTVDREEEGKAQLRLLARANPGGLIGQLSGGLLAQREARTKEAAATYRSLLDRTDLGPQIRRNIEGLLASLPR